MTNNADIIWDAYLKNRSDSTRLPLLNYYAPIIRDLANEILVDHPDVSYNTLFSGGLFKLWDVIEGYNSDLTGFEDYCMPLVKEAMLEELD